MPNSSPKSLQSRAADVSGALRRRAWLFGGVGLFSGVINLLALTGSIYMLQVYDRVIPSRSLPTLVGLTILMVGLYLANGLLDILRSRVMNRIGLKFDKDLRDQVFDVVLLLPLRMRKGTEGLQPIRDLDQIRSFLGTPGPTALFDLPWMPVFLLIIYLLHPWLGMLALFGGLLLMTVAILTEFRSRKPVRAAAQSGAARHVFTEAARRNAEVIRAMGMGARMQGIFREHSRRHLTDQRAAVDVIGGLGAISKVLRMILQSAMLGLGAVLVIRGEATAGVMIAGSILMSRALAPVELAIANWRSFVSARQSYHRLKSLFSTLPQVQETMELPAPRSNIVVQGLWVTAPGDTRPIIQDVSFKLEAGAGLGIIGLSASGKSTLARAIVGVWQPMPQRGSVRLDGAALDQWSPDRLGRHIGYLPQDIELFDGTVAQNISRFDLDMTPEQVIEAAQTAGVHELILQLPQGYETRIGESGATLSAGQRQRVGLARAVYGNPFLLVLDEPNSNLDALGDRALEQTIRSVRGRGGIVIVIAHRPSVLAGLDELLALANGRMMAFGPKEEVLRKVTGQPERPAPTSLEGPTRPGPQRPSPQRPDPRRPSPQQSRQQTPSAQTPNAQQPGEQQRGRKPFWQQPSPATAASDPVGQGPAAAAAKKPAPPQNPVRSTTTVGADPVTKANGHIIGSGKKKD